MSHRGLCYRDLKNCDNLVGRSVGTEVRRVIHEESCCSVSGLNHSYTMLFTCNIVHRRLTIQSNGIRATISWFFFNASIQLENRTLEKCSEYNNGLGLPRVDVLQNVRLAGEKISRFLTVCWNRNISWGQFQCLTRSLGSVFVLWAGWVIRQNPLGYGD